MRGIGVHVVRELEKVPSSPNIKLEIIGGGTSSDLEVGGVDKLIIIDAAMMGGKQEMSTASTLKM